MSFWRISGLSVACALALAACSDKEEQAAAPQVASGASPLATDYRLKDGAPFDIDAFFALMPGDAKVTYESAAFDKKLGAMVARNLRFADADDGEGLIAARAEFFGVDMQAIERIRGAEDARADAPFEKVFDAVRFYNVSTQGFDETDPRITADGLAFDQLSIRQGGFAGDGSGDEGAMFFNAFKLGGLYLKGLKLEVDDGADGVFKMRAPDLRVVGLGGGKIDAVIAKDAAYELGQSDSALAAMSEAMGPRSADILAGPLKTIIAPNNQQTRIETFEWRNIDFSGLLAWGLKGEAPPVSARDLLDLGTIKASNFESYVEGRRAAAFDEVTVSKAEFTWLIPSYIRTDTKGGVYDFTAYAPQTDDQMIALLKNLKLDRVAGDGYAQWSWKADSGKAAFEYNANADGLADFSMAADFSDMTIEDAPDDVDEARIIFGGDAKLNGFTITIADENALNAIFSIAALQMGGTGEELRLSTPALLRLAGLEVAQMHPRFSDYIDAAATFLAKGGALEVKAAPLTPLAIADIKSSGDPLVLPDRLNLTVTQNE